MLPGTIRENVAFTHPDATDQEILDALASVRLTDLVDRLPDGLDSQLNGSAVSGGQRQRIALARAILRSPDLLILDEATAQIDALTEAAVTDCVTELAKDRAIPGTGGSAPDRGPHRAGRPGRIGGARRSTRDRRGTRVGAGRIEGLTRV